MVTQAYKWPMLVTKATPDIEVKDVSERDRTVTSVITTDRVDRDGEVVVTKGLNFDGFDANPVVLFMHDPCSPIGKCNGRTAKTHEHIAVTEFAETDLADEIFKLYMGGFLKGWSIGMDYNTVQREPLTEADVRKRADWAGANAVIRSASVVEYSAVSIPANAEALSRAHQGGLIKHTKAWFPSATAEQATVEVPEIKVVTLPSLDDSVSLLAVEYSARDIADRAGESVRKLLRRLKGYD